MTEADAGTRPSASALARACHPAPAATVTIAVTALAAAAGRDVLGCALVLVTVLVGQLSVGWSNDALDAERDAAVGRAAKPTVAGAVRPPLLLRLAVVALVVSVVLSFVAAGISGGACHALFLASAWAYNLGLKSTRLSLVPYAVGFGALPGFVTFGLDPSVAPELWMTVAAGLLGVAAGLANAAPDIDDDLATGVHGTVGRLGAGASRVACVLVLVLATAVLVVGAGRGSSDHTDAGIGGVAAAGAVVAVLLLGAVGLRWRGGRHLFAFVLVIALLDVTLLATTL